MSDWRQLYTPRRHDLDALLRDSLRRAIRFSSKSRQQICDELSIRLGRKISSNMLDNWTGESKRAWRLPADCVPVLCEILDNDTMQRQLLSESLKEAVEVGEWAINSWWILECVKVKAGKSMARELRRKQIYKRLLREKKGAREDS